jgi:hypothetical protein
VLIDEDSAFSGNAYTAPATGNYDIDWALSMVCGASGDRCGVKFYKGATNFAYVAVSTHSTDIGGCGAGSITVPLTVGDVITMKIFSSGGNTYTLKGTGGINSFWRIKRRF